MFKRNYGGMCGYGPCGSDYEQPTSKEFEAALLAEKERMLEEALKNVRELKKNLTAEPAKAA